MSAETAAKALILYERRAFGITTDAVSQPNTPSILGAYGRILVLRDEICHQYPWITAAADAIHSELVHSLMAVTLDTAAEVVLGNDPVLRYEQELENYRADEKAEEETANLPCDAEEA